MFADPEPVFLCKVEAYGVVNPLLMDLLPLSRAGL